MSERPIGDAMSSETSYGRLGEFFDLSDEERAALAAILGPAQSLQRGRFVRREGVAPTQLFLLLDGWVASSIPVADGRQQTVKIYLPEDLLGAPSLCVARSAESLTALTPVVVRRLSRRDLMGVFVRFPRIAASLFLSAQRERIALMESLTLMGQTNAEARIAGMLTHLYDRLTALGHTQSGAFQFPLTQAQIGDLVGFSPVHVNRTLRALERAGLIRRGPKMITLPDLDRLRSLSGLARHDVLRQPEWMDFG